MTEHGAFEPEPALLRSDASGATPLDDWAMNPDGGRFSTFAIGTVRDQGEMVRPLSGSAAGELVVLMPLDSAISFETDTVAAVCGSGSMILIDTARPIRITDDGAAAIRLTLPRALARLKPEELHGLHGLLVDGQKAAGRFLSAQLEILFDLSPSMEPKDMHGFGEIAAMVLSSALRVATAPKSKPWVAEDLSVASIRAFVEANLSDAALSPSRICSEFGISRSVLYRAVEPLGGIASLIRNERLKRARSLLEGSSLRRGTIAGVSAAVGFSSEAVFSRAFRARYGVSPSDIVRRNETGADRAEPDERWMRRWLAHSRVTD